MMILTLNCRTYSIQYQLFDWKNKSVLAHGEVERIVVGDSFITHRVPGLPNAHRDAECSDHKAALGLILKTLSDARIGVIKNVNQISAVGHRVVHGGEKFTRSVQIDADVIDAIRDCATLAPLHNTPNLAGIEAARALLPNLPQVAIFDTAFHQTMPERAYMYPLPYDWYKTHGIRRYGFHGHSHLYAARRGAELLGKAPAETNLITVHTGNGVSLCAVQGGKSIDTSMGLTPLEGVMMGTRCGDIDPGITSFVMKEMGLSATEMELFLNQKSGLAGIAGRYMSRRSALHEASQGDERCRIGLQMEAYRLRKYIGSYIAVTGPIDAIVFSFGEGWVDWPVRGMALVEMEHFGIKLDPVQDLMALGDGKEHKISAPDSKIAIYVLPSGEELVLNEDVAAVLKWH
ncbi:acetate kinase [Geomesophilobacter sediminis]|uniref:Acetate kinase n=1 Tax=Geomesophilobacter sediminis TaxID=2798584 RepID=A0A8J7M1U7_9BACT|nr:acetate kinase [Geomesophilobacter sediminis]MBJ6726973.1 acetate kinase [Geomesophilobacter sediminis]